MLSWRRSLIWQLIVAFPPDLSLILTSLALLFVSLPRIPGTACSMQAVDMRLHGALLLVRVGYTHWWPPIARTTCARSPAVW